MVSLRQFYEHSVEPQAQFDRSVKSPKLYGVVELEIEVSELLENISIALHYLQKLSLLAATNSELGIFQKDIMALIYTVTNLKHKIQKTFKDVTFQEDIHGLISSKENIRELTSTEQTDKTWRNIQEPKELRQTQSETAFHYRFPAGSSTIASTRKNLPWITEKRQKKVKSKEKKQNHRKIGLNIFEEIIQDSGCKQSESKQIVKLSSYDFSNNSEATTFPLSWTERNIKKWKKLEDLNSKEIKNSENVKEISDPIFLKQVEYQQFQTKQDLTKTTRIIKNLDKVRCSVPRMSWNLI
ncbi:unnamed protein product [Acanthocheilonema viteae]|uniref:Uncharacterized protein n=1 Tax=Acanthocheilonema viteae TaxID=6277 RepID=A0A498SPT0_ACAVI|nr:unnamed protein product [Acanthocheilonema viteae]